MSFGFEKNVKKRNPPPPTPLRKLRLCRHWAWNVKLCAVCSDEISCSSATRWTHRLWSVRCRQALLHAPLLYGQQSAHPHILASSSAPYQRRCPRRCLQSTKVYLAQRHSWEICLLRFLQTSTWTELTCRKSTHLYDPFIGHARQRHNETRTVGAQSALST